MTKTSVRFEIKREFYSIPCPHSPEDMCLCDMQRKSYIEVTEEDLRKIKNILLND